MKPVQQCKSCPWRVDCVPDEDIPRYSEALHRDLAKTIRSGMETLLSPQRRVMACHYSTPGDEIPCAGWLSNQLGPGNNLGVRLAVATGKLPPPVIDGEQHGQFEDTFPKRRKK